MNPEFPYTVFFAIPFDPAIRSMYQGIRDVLTRSPKYARRLNFALGTGIVGPSMDFANMRAFKQQNADLLTQFYSQINSSDIIVADLTNNNGNVHLELGIALSQKKNILRVTGRNIVEVSSDIKGYYVDPYQNEQDLRAKLETYLDMFLDIKRIPLSSSSPFYRRRGRLTIENRDYFHHSEHLMRMRDGELKANFHFSFAHDDTMWFGAYIRSVLPWFGGYLIYVRKNGSLEIDQMQGTKLAQKQYAPMTLNNDSTFHFVVDGSNLVASLDDNFDNYVEVHDLDNQSFGSVYLGSFGSVVDLDSIEIVSRDTIDFS